MGKRRNGPFYSSSCSPSDDSVQEERASLGHAKRTEIKNGGPRRADALPSWETSPYDQHSELFVSDESPNVRIKQEKTNESVRPSLDPSTPSKSCKKHKKKKKQHKSRSDRTTPASQSVEHGSERPTPIPAGRLGHPRGDDRGRGGSSEASHVKNDQRSRSHDGHSHRRKKDRRKRRQYSALDETPTHPQQKEPKKPHHSLLSASDPATVRSREVPDTLRESTNLSLPARANSNNSALPNLVAREVNLGRTYDKIDPTADHPDGASLLGLSHHSASQNAGSATRQSSIAPPNFYHGVPRGLKSMNPRGETSTMASPRELAPQSKSSCGKPGLQDNRSTKTTVSDRPMLARKDTNAVIRNRPNTPPIKREGDHGASTRPQTDGRSYIDLTQQTPPKNQAQALTMASPSPIARRARHVTLPPSIPQKRKAVGNARPNEPVLDLYDRNMKRLRAQRARNNEFFEEMENEMRLFRFQSLPRAQITSKDNGTQSKPDDRLSLRHAGPVASEVDDPGEGRSAPRSHENANNRTDRGDNTTTVASRSHVAPPQQRERGNPAPVIGTTANIRPKKGPTVEEQKQHKPEFPSDIPEHGRASNDELIRIGKMRSRYGRHCAAPYAFSWHGRLRASFTFLLTKQNEDGTPAWSASDIARIRR